MKLTNIRIGEIIHEVEESMKFPIGNNSCRCTKVPVNKTYDAVELSKIAKAAYDAGVADARAAIDRRLLRIMPRMLHPEAFSHVGFSRRWFNKVCSLFRKSV